MKQQIYFRSVAIRGEHVSSEFQFRKDFLVVFALGQMIALILAPHSITVCYFTVNIILKSSKKVEKHFTIFYLFIVHFFNILAWGSFA